MGGGNFWYDDVGNGVNSYFVVSILDVVEGCRNIVCCIGLVWNGNKFDDKYGGRYNDIVLDEDGLLFVVGGYEDW